MIDPIYLHGKLRQTEPNTHLFGNYGAMWADWKKQSDYTLEDVLQMEPPHRHEGRSLIALPPSVVPLILLEQNSNILPDFVFITGFSFSKVGNE